ncbi:MAG: AbrB/MazE/SpoVT family DNA-binding domain-containing protein [Nanoarchaeota archaeon]|nr:AbrB/MazE/SpoVT family DNA-binding domain-containing protein [Nanoarchaeota archaeon]MBU1030737.1 AbrB/MazE/SpoVT family DNA-binding domain-containing protein [Nanoarchaeota archaeon]MBU1850606.1 AbrB/MazE/SpoVT family DNA-binding domain-containing protein [Nanoarchaeota archaeon]
MKRKVNRVGQNTLTVSLPSKWASELKIKPGDELEVIEDSKSLIIQREGSPEKIKKAVINTDDWNKLMLNRFFEELYRQGVEEIVVNHTNETIPDYKHNKEISVSGYVNKVIERFIGLEVVSQTANKIIIQSLIKSEEHEKTDVVLRRIYFLIKDFLAEFLNAMNNDFSSFFEKVYDYHDNIAKFIYYYERLLNISDLSECKKSRLFGLMVIIDKVVDLIRHTAERVNEAKNVNDKIKLYLKEIFDLFLEQFDIVLKKNFSPKELEAIVKKRYELLHQINKEDFTGDGLKIMSECKIILHTINEFCETYVALTVEKYIS